MQYAALVLNDKFDEFIQDKYKKANNAEVMWLQSLKSMPNGVVIYNYEEKKIIFENQKINQILNGNRDLNQEADNII